MTEYLPQIFEATMLVCFGLGWPISILKSLRTKYVRGKSVGFMMIISVGYVAGILSKLADTHLLEKAHNPVIWLYVLNLAFVLTDLALYYRYRHNPHPLAAQKNSPAV